MGYLYNVYGVTNATNPTPTLFFNVGAGQAFYWSDTEFAPSTADFAWGYNFGNANQGWGNKISGVSAWAVRDGDVGAVPLPGGVWLLGTAMAFLMPRFRHRL